MKLYEFQGKQLFSEYGIPIPKGNIIFSRNEIVNINNPVVLKSQVLTGGRGKAGGIKVWDGKENINNILNDMFSEEIKGEKVAGVLIEEKVEILNEFYLSITYDGSTATPLIVVSASGGVEIEVVAEKNPKKIAKIPFNILTGPKDYQIKYISEFLGYDNYKEIKNIISKLYCIYNNCDATLVEINPLVVTKNGLVALDSKIVLDDNAEYRNRSLFTKYKNQQQSCGQNNYKVRKDTITYVSLDGTIGLISDGAGTGMLALDLIKDAGGEAANFCELGGITNAEVMYDSMKIVLENPNVKSLLIVLIGGFNRMDEMAKGIVKYKEEYGLDIPIAIRMCGTLEEIGKDIMHKVNIATFDKLQDAVNEAVTKAGGEQFAYTN